MRDERYAAQKVLWRLTKLPRLSKCGSVPISREGKIEFVLTGQAGTPEARGGIRGLQSCSSVWACPVCSEKINAVRQLELEQAIEKWQAGGGAVVFGTFTMRHHRGQALDDLWRAIAPSWTHVVSGASWHGTSRAVGDKARFGVAGWVRLVEVKHGEHGWHPHVHVLLFLDQGLTDQQLDDLRGRMFARWDRALSRRGYSSVEFDADGHAVAVDLRRVEDSTGVADYLSKATYGGATAAAAAYELTGSQSKRAGKGGRTPFEVLRALVLDPSWTVDRDSGEVVVDRASGVCLDDGQGQRPSLGADLAIWWEWEAASKGKRQLTWSRGLRDLVSLDDERTDEEVIEDEALGGMPISDMTVSEWRESGWRTRRADVLRWIEEGVLVARLEEWRRGHARGARRASALPDRR